MDPTARFAACLAAEVLPLDVASFVIAAHAHPGLDTGEQTARLDRLAAASPSSTPSELGRWLFGSGAFCGNTVDYYDPENSMLDTVLDRRLGIPITLSVLAIEIGRRLDIDLVGVGMPGHFLLRVADDPDHFIDTFAGGASLTAAGAESLFYRLHGTATAFSRELLEPAEPVDIVRRILANLMAIYLDRSGARAGPGSPHRSPHRFSPAPRADAAWVLRLRTMLPGAPTDDVRRLADVLARLGRYEEAALEHDRLATMEPLRAEQHLAIALRLRAASN